MRIVYLGAEVPSNRLILEDCGVRDFGFSFYRAWRRGLPKTKSYDLTDYFPEGSRIYVYNGAPDDEVDSEYLSHYATFLENNYDNITFIYGEDVVVAEDLTKHIVLWDPETGKQGLEKLVDDGILNIGIRGEDIETNPFLAATTQNLAFEDGASFHAIAAMKPDNLRQVKVDTVSTMSWLSPMMRGETIVWDGSKIVRYPKRMKEQARPRYAHIYEKAGLDFDKILSDDAKEVSKLAIWSYEQYNSRDISYMNENISGSEIVEPTPSNVDNLGSSMRKLNQRESGEIVTLPVVGYDIETVIEEEDGRPIIKDLPMLRTNSTSLRICNTCFVAANCPAYKPDTQCAYKLPVEIKTKDQLKALINAMIEMQGQRVLFAKFTEDLNGGYPDPNVSQELDRLFKIIKTTKDLDDSQSFIRMTVESKASAGVLSSLFGDRAQTLRELPQQLSEDQTTQIIQGQIE